MAKSLQEQLLQSGAVRPKQARKARREKAASNKVARQQGQRPTDEQDLQRRVAATTRQKRARDAQLNAQQQARREADGREHGIAQIIARNAVDADAKGDAAVAYSYTIDNRIRRIEVSDKQRRDLAAGRLAIVRYRKATTLVARAVAQRLMETIPGQVWLVTGNDEPADPHDPYAAFQVPDDLMW